MEVIIEIKDQIIEARKTNKPILLKKVLPKTPDWKYIMEYASTKFNENPKHPIHNDHFLKNKQGNTVPMYYMDKLDLTMWYIELPECKEMSDLLIPDCTSINPSSFKLLVNFLGMGNENNIHKDNSEVISWTLLNSVEYRIYEDKEEYPFEETLNIQDEPYKSYIIEAGDALYMPKGTVHQSVIIEPRASLIVSSTNGF